MSTRSVAPPVNVADARTYPDPLDDAVPVVSLDVECVATGPKHHDRSVAQIAVVCARTERVLCDVFVKQTKEVRSYLTPLTGIDKETLETRGIPLDEALERVRSVLGPRHVVVGQGVLKDVEEWLGLTRGVDYGDLIEMTGIWRVWNERYGSWSVFSQDHLVRCLLATEVSSTHDAAGDCVKSIRLFRLFHRLLTNDAEGLAAARAKLLAIAPEPSFSKRFPIFEGVCQGGRTCSCGAATFFSS
ncbi:Exonuclease, RNase T/DNA polymerase III [Ostreococcus tauri]|uniref:Exonuclease, RNase T/DNA polymerase III n=1 Tax=Ostreococcus tauri TaxID=70448 RepID=Q00YG0_OSTTA|nr:Exonuclease, RNase T/DNA polymerase III [Ostreococcus tauri]OUS46425.1 hypothetical protein BE221DRAFT_74299 [Ostreococcus tauri]CAL55949.1 Exonuclease, RNase T/DNA polymerase III [Ostreococcus tauri]|eukprot:XP_003082146.1 Exonuclease, RNase T/DNA polymerase III [Ostreococcus tauri]